MTRKNLSQDVVGDSDDLTSAARVLGALDSILRLRIIRILQTGDRFVHELVAELGKSQPLISQHLKVLKTCGLVESERRGREVIYRLTREDIGRVIDLAAALAEAIRSSEEDRQPR